MNSFFAMAEEYLDHRRQLGFKMETEGRLLLDFARYVDAAGHHSALTTDLALRWARLPVKTTRLYQARRLEIVRGFARYLAIFEPETQIPPDHLLGSAHRRNQPFVFSPAEITRLLRAAQALKPSDGLRPHTYRTLLGLLASTGLRPSEALNLTCQDVDLDRSLLTIRETKFHKSRFVPLHPTTAAALREYRRFRVELTEPRSESFLLNQKGTHLCLRTVDETFRHICVAAKIQTAAGERAPRLYDLRHTFACRRLIDWYRSGVDVQNALLALSTFLGHVKVTDTYWYLSGVPDLFSFVGAKFERYAATNSRSKS